MSSGSRATASWYLPAALPYSPRSMSWSASPRATAAGDTCGAAAGRWGAGGCWQPGARTKGGPQGRVDVLGAVPEREAVRLGQKLEVAIGLGPDGLVGDEGPADLDVAPGAEARAAIAPRHDHDAVPVEVHVAPADIEPGARGVDGQVAVLDHQDARPLDRAVESQAREGRRGVELAAEEDELGGSRGPQVDRLPYRRIARGPPP